MAEGYGETVDAEPTWSEDALAATVERLAAPSDQQIAWLRAQGTYPSLDELALAFDDEVRRVRDALTRDHPLMALDRHLSAMSGSDNKADLWMPEALDSELWSRARSLANEALRELERKPR
jgi:hypothetical protein